MPYLKTLRGRINRFSGGFTHGVIRLGVYRSTGSAIPLVAVGTTSPASGVTQNLEALLRNEMLYLAGSFL